MSENMIERVAKAIFFRGGEQDDMQWEHGQSYLREMAREQARAALKAMRSPTPEMILAGVHHDNMGDMEGRWNAMIDAALAPIEQTTER